MEEGWSRRRKRTYYDAELIQKEIDEMELLRPKQLLTAIEMDEPSYSSISPNNLRFFSNGLLCTKGYYSFTYLKDIDTLLDFQITFYGFLSHHYEKLPFKFNLSLTVHDFLSLNNFDDSKNFITDSVINIYSLLISKFYEVDIDLTIFDVMSGNRYTFSVN